jgi:hypothetical protein
MYSSPRSIIAVLLLSLAGCAGTPDRMKPERDPSWMRGTMTGSRIVRARTRSGEAASAESVVTTAPAELRNLPSVEIRVSR